MNKIIGRFGRWPISSAILTRQCSSSSYRRSKTDDLDSQRFTNVPPEMEYDVKFFREKDFLTADLDPLKLSNLSEESLQDELDDSVLFKNSNPLTKIHELRDLTSSLEAIYSEGSSLEASHIDSSFEKNWLFNEFEALKLQNLEDKVKVRIAEVLLNGQQFDRFTAAKFPTVKRYGGEGAESMLVFCDSLFEEAPKIKTEDIVIGIAHRGRNNLLTTLLKCPPSLLFRKMKGLPGIPEDAQEVMDDDVLSHIRMSVDLDNGVHVSLLPNPSHLEAVNPVVQGKIWSKLHRKIQLDEKEAFLEHTHRAVGLMIHGDGAFAGQGIVAECFNMAYIPGYDVGGSIHLITNNQVAFTMQKGFSFRHTSDMAKMINCPIIHVNGDSPEDAYKAALLCLKYKQLFRKDIVCNLICYRKWGHNEMDDATITQPKMYDLINSKKSPPDFYLERLSPSLSQELSHELETKCASFKDFLNEHFKNVENFQPALQSFQGNWKTCRFASPNITAWDTGFDLQTLKYIGVKSVTFPEDFNVQSKLMKTLTSRIGMMNSEKGIDWATAEALAIGSLMVQGQNVRISGEDVGRGTFSHRHCQVVDQKTGDIFMPLRGVNNDVENSGSLEVTNSILSEEAVLGFDYGVSIDCPETLVIWEAQFGDFFNGAQIIIDTFVASGESKWGLQSGIVMLLPHGLDGMGPEHSSCRLERFLQLTDSFESSIDSDRVNMFVVNPTTPAQYFHLLRRQQVRDFRKPLIVASPKKLIRLPEAKSNLRDFEPGTYFKPVIDDPVLKSNETVKKVIFVCGKLYYALNSERSARNIGDVALVRLEQLVPFPTSELQSVVVKYPNCQSFIWCQEEHRNSGAWSFVNPRFRSLVGVELEYVGRSERAVSATAIGTRHKNEESQVLEEVFRRKK